MPNTETSSGSGQLGLLQSLIQQHPVYGSPGQTACADMLEAKLVGAGWDRVWQDTYRAEDIADEKDYVTVSEFGERYADDSSAAKANVIGVLESGTDGPTVILNGHYDVDPVSSPGLWSFKDAWRSGRVQDGKIIGRGATDMLGGLTSLIEVSSRFATERDKWRGRIVLCAVTDEEIGGNGTLHSLKTLEKEDYLRNYRDITSLIAEPSDGIVSAESLGFMHLKFVGHRDSVHMGMATKANSALYDTIQLITDFNDILRDASQLVDKTHTDRRLIHNFGIISAGEDPAIPVSEVSTEATVFYPIDVAKSGLEAAIKQIVHQRFLGVIATEFSGFGFDGHRASDSVMAQVLLQTQTATPLTQGVFRSPCDARIFSSFGLDDVVVYGPGSLVQAHAVNEYLEISEIGIFNTNLHLALSQILKK